MNTSDDILFILSALGAFNGLALSLYILYLEGKKHISNVFLGVALLMISVRAGKSVFFYFNDNLAELFIQVGIIACFYIGPFLYFFIYTLCHQEHSPPKWTRHLLFLTPFILIPTFLFPYFEYRELWCCYFLRLIYLQWLVYLLLSFYYIRPIILQSRKEKISLKPPIKWALHVLVGFSLVWLAYFSSGYTSYIVGALTFTMILYLLISFLVKTKNRQVFLLRKNTILLQDEEESKDLLKKIDIIFKQEEIYKQSELKSADIARLLGIPNYKLSQILNKQLGENFNAYINSYRVGAAKKMLRENPELTIEAIGKECGFKSKSSFYSAFKKETGTTPSKFV